MLIMSGADQVTIIDLVTPTNGRLTSFDTIEELLTKKEAQDIELLKELFKMDSKNVRSIHRNNTMKLLFDDQHIDQQDCCTQKVMSTFAKKVGDTST